jgi:hypothetical protein
MAVDPVQANPLAADFVAAFCETRLPALFEDARRALESAAQGGDTVAAARLAALTADKVCSLVRFSGGGASEELWLLTDRSGLTVQRSAPPSTGFGYALEVSRAAAELTIEMLERNELEPDRIARALLVMGSEKARALFSAARCAFDVTVLHVPVLGNSAVRLAFGRTDIPARPDFTVEVEYDELEDARERGTPPHQIFLAGKMKVDGDAAAAMRLAMTLAQLV